MHTVAHHSLTYYWLCAAGWLAFIIYVCIALGFWAAMALWAVDRAVTSTGR